MGIIFFTVLFRHWFSRDGTPDPTRAAPIKRGWPVVNQADAHLTRTIQIEEWSLSRWRTADRPTVTPLDKVRQAISHEFTAINWFNALSRTRVRRFSLLSKLLLRITQNIRFQDVNSRMPLCRCNPPCEAGLDYPLARLPFVPTKERSTLRYIDWIVIPILLTARCN